MTKILAHGVMTIGLLGLAACGGASGPRRPAVISHVVLISLHDPGERAALLADCDRVLPTIPGVRAYAAGRHLDIGRAGVTGDFDVGVYLGFDSAADYTAFVADERHAELVGRWGPGIASMRVFDLLDETE